MGEENDELCILNCSELTRHHLSYPCLKKQAEDDVLTNEQQSPEAVCGSSDCVGKGNLKERLSICTGSESEEAFSCSVSLPCCAGKNEDRMMCDGGRANTSLAPAPKGYVSTCQCQISVIKH